MNRPRLKKQIKKVKLHEPALSKQPITTTLGGEEINEQETYGPPDTKLLQSDLSVCL